MDTAEAQQRLALLRSRGEVKALAQETERRPELYETFLGLAQERGLVEAGERPTGKDLVRRLRERQEQAQVRRNPIHRDEAFVCTRCQAEVPPGGARVRDHCPHCLASLHVDVVPGDRAAGCGGVLLPERFDASGAELRIHYRCVACGHRHRVRAHPDDQVPADLSLPWAHVGSPPPRSPAQTLPLRVLGEVQRLRLWAPHDEVLVAVSGGMDSMVLLEVLAQTMAAHRARLRVACVNHGLRPEAETELELVRERARDLGLRFHPLRLALGAGPGLAARARRARREALVGQGMSRIATAHHRDDQAETVIQRLMAGSGASGLAAMRSLDPPWCRPLLAEPRSVIREFAETQGIPWAEDPSNPGSERGRLRDLLAGLGEQREGATRGLARSAALLARDDAFLESLLDPLWPTLRRGDGLDLSSWGALPPVLAARAVRRLCAEHGRTPRADLLETLLRELPREGWCGSIGGGTELRVQGGLLVLRGA